MKATYRTTLCSLVLFALRVVGAEDPYPVYYSTTTSLTTSLISGEDDPELIQPGSCATVRCGSACFMAPCSENQVCVPGKQIGCCPEAKCCDDPCKKSKVTKAMKCQKHQVCQASASETKEFCPTAECVNRCSTTTCFIGDFCGQMNIKCNDGLVCRNRFKSPSDCCPYGSECV